jgi:hypothetical protein
MIVTNNLPYSVSEISIPTEKDQEVISSCFLTINGNVPLEDLKILSLVPLKIEIVKKTQKTSLLKSPTLWIRPVIGSICGYLSPLWAPRRWNIGWPAATELGPTLVIAGLVDAVFEHYYNDGTLKSPLWNFLPGIVTALNLTMNFFEVVTPGQTLMAYLTYRVAHRALEILT